ncbi:hypothetical protein O0544_15660 [Edwardsiella anguillarum]|nr:hypothetical protein [Edwardsiella anguillarum]
MNFVSDALFDGGRLRRLTAIDRYTRECLKICARQNLRSTEIAGILEYWNTGILGCWNTGMLGCWDAGMLGCWDAGMLGC